MKLFDLKFAPDLEDKLRSGVTKNLTQKRKAMPDYDQLADEKVKGHLISNPSTWLRTRRWSQFPFWVLHLHFEGKWIPGFPTAVRVGHVAMKQFEGFRSWLGH